MLDNNLDNFFLVQRAPAHQIGDTTLPRSDPNLSAPDKGKNTLFNIFLMSFKCSLSFQGNDAISRSRSFALNTFFDALFLIVDSEMVYFWFYGGPEMQRNKN